MEGLAPRTDVTTSRTEVSIRESDTGFTVTALPSDIEFTRNGEKVDNPLLSLLEKLAISIETDQQGQVLAVRGYDRLATLMDSLLPPAVSVTLSGQFTEESMVSDEIYEWNDHFADLVGWHLVVGDISVGAVLMGLGNGEEITTLVATQITDTTTCEYGPCVVLRLKYGSDLDEVALFLETPIEEILETVELTEEAFGGDTKFSSESARVIYPNTLLYESEFSSRVFDYDIELPGVGTKHVTQDETREYRFEYPDGI
ncbi:hypothetical protein KQH82_05155 [bacterium]|nr:hypothetical protein [bacterium]